MADRASRAPTLFLSKTGADDNAVSAQMQKPESRSWRRFRRHRLAMASLAIMILLSLSAVFAPVIGGYDPNEVDLKQINLPPSEVHWLGTDGVGRDYFSRVVFAGRISLSMGLVAVSISTLIGTLLGSLSGYYRGAIDHVIQRFTEVIMCFPSLLIIITIVTIVGPSIFNAMIAIGILGWTGLCRLVRGQFLAIRETSFVEAARCTGVPDRIIITRHILPNITAPIIIVATFAVAGAIMTEASLSFLGLGVLPPTPSWGNMLNQSQNLEVLTRMPWRWLPPGLLIATCMICE